MKKGIIYFYTDGSEVAERVRQALDERQINYIALPRMGPPGKVPAIASNKYVFEGIDEICEYLLPEMGNPWPNSSA